MGADHEELSLDDCLCSEPVIRTIGEQDQWLLVRREWHKGSFGISLNGEFEREKLTFSAEVIEVSAHRQPEAILLTAFYDGEELERLGSDCKSAEWCLIDPQGQQRDFEVLWDEFVAQAALSAE